MAGFFGRMGGAALVAGLLATSALAQTDGQVITKQYDDGSVYEGTFKNGRQDGTGTYRLPNGFVYTGQWLAGEIKGTGKAIYPTAASTRANSPPASRRATARSPSPTAAPMRATGRTGR